MTEDAAFWDFSLRFYAAPQVAALCLDLQDRLGADVNIVLYLLFRAEGGVALNAQEIAGLDEATRGWRTQVVQPLRAARRSLKPHEGLSAAHTALRAKVKAAELEAERLQQQLLAAAAPAGRPVGDAAAAARSSLATYLQLIGAAVQGADALLNAFGTHRS